MDRSYDFANHSELIVSARDVCAQARTTIAHSRNAVARAHVLMQQSRTTAAARQRELAVAQNRPRVTHI